MQFTPLITLKISKMINLRQILAAIIMMTLIVSCDKDENDSKTVLKTQTISAKWNVNSSDLYDSFEFNESGNYIVVKKPHPNSQFIYFGTYEIINGTSIELSDFGTIEVSSISNNSISFSINTDRKAKTSINASKQAEMAKSSKTDLICKTWEMFSVNGEPVAGTEMELTVLFSKAGTYFVTFSNPMVENDGEIAQWKWKDAAQTQIYYFTENDLVWDDEFFVEIPELTTSTLKIVEGSDTYVLRAIPGK